MLSLLTFGVVTLSRVGVNLKELGVREILDVWASATAELIDPGVIRTTNLVGEVAEVSLISTSAGSASLSLIQVGTLRRKTA